MEEFSLFRHSEEQIFEKVYIEGRHPVMPITLFKPGDPQTITEPNPPHDYRSHDLMLCILWKF